MGQNLQKLARKDEESKVELAKRESQSLRGDIKETLARPDADSFSHDDYQRLKFHGIYQQEDRDSRAANKALGLGQDHLFMIRIKIPAGEMSPEQYLAVDRLATEQTWNDSIRLTTRQNIQLHGVVKNGLQPIIQGVNDVLLSTLAGCGDVERNIMAPPAPIQEPAHQRIRETAHELARSLCPQTRAYHEIWYDGQKVDSSAPQVEDEEPLYGKQYLPRKFKTGLGLPEDNSIDVHSQDVGLVGLVEEGELKGFNLLAGGGFGMTHRKELTFARLASPLGRIGPDEAVDAVRAIASIHRDYGDRTDRTHARLKYIVEEHELDAFRAELEERAGISLQPWVEVGPLEHKDWLGAHEQGDGGYFYGVQVPNGRVMDTEQVRFKTAFRKIVQGLRPRVVVTPTQNILFGGLDEKGVKTIERVLKTYNVPRAEDLTATRRYAMACPAMPTCGLALTESERVFPEVLTDFEEEMKRLGMEQEPVTIRMTGCPNGCARPYSADIGLVGHKPGHYDVFLGGRLEGDRMVEHYSENVPKDQLVPTLRPLLEAWVAQRHEGESFGDFYDRVLRPEGRRDIQSGERGEPARPRVEEALGVTASA